MKLRPVENIFDHNGNERVPIKHFHLYVASSVTVYLSFVGQVDGDQFLKFYITGEF